MKRSASASLLFLFAAGPAWADLGPFSVARLGMPTLADSATGAGTTVVVGDGGEIWSSADAVSWTQRVAGSPGRRSAAVAHGGGTFVAVASGPSGGVALASPDGASWTEVGIPVSASDVVYGAGQFVAVASNRVLRSPDGMQWTSTTLPPPWSVLSIAYGGGQFVAVGFGRRLLTSPDAVSWTDRTANVPAALSYLAGVAWTGNRFVVVGQGGIVVSQDGVQWQQVSTISYDAVAAGDGVVVAVNFSHYAFSTTGESWTTGVFPQTAGVAPGAIEVSFGSGRFVAVGVGGSLRTSPDGTSWTNGTLPASRFLRAVAHDGTRFCATAANGAAMTSTDGLAWTSGTGPSGTAYGLVATGARFVSAGSTGNNGRFHVSTDCSVWTPASWTPPSASNGSFFQDVAQGAGRLVAVGSRFTATGEEPLVATSSDGGDSWATVPSGLSGFEGALWSVAYGNGRWTAAGRRVSTGEPPVTTSTDGVAWSSVSSAGFESGTTVSSIVYGSGLFVAAGSGIWTSADGLSFTRRVPQGDVFNAVQYSAGRFVAVGGALSGQGVVSVSTNGIDWTVVQRPPRNLWGAGFSQAPAADRAVVVGDSIVLQAPGYVPLLTLDALPAPEATQQATVTLRLSAPAVDPVTVAYQTSDQTAVAGLDYTAVAGVITMPPGASAQPIQVPLAVDGLWEGDETFRVVVAQVTGATPQANAATVTIVDTPTLSVDDAARTEGDAGSASAGLVVYLSHPASQTLTVAYATGGGTATPGVDYTPASGILTFTSGKTGLLTPPNVLGDTAVEPDETFSLTISSPSFGSIQDATGDAVIQDDDAAPLAPRELAHGMLLHEDLEAGPDAFRIAQAPRASYEVVVDAIAGDSVPLVLERLAADNATVLGQGGPVGIGTGVSLRWVNSVSEPVENQHVRLRGACAAACGSDDVYRLRAYETTLRAPRFSNVGGQATLLVLQNPSGAPVEGTVYFWDANGSPLLSRPLALAPRQTLVLNTAAVPGLLGRSGSMTVAHTAPYGVLVGKAVALEPATGFGFDTPLSPRPR